MLLSIATADVASGLSELGSGLCLATAGRESGLQGEHRQPEAEPAWACPLGLVKKKIRISGAQLIGARAIIYKDGEEPYNFQFLVDAFSSKDTTSSPLDLGIAALVVRRGEVRFDRLDKPTTPDKFNPNHLHIKDLSLTARVFVQKPDSLAIDLRSLSFREQSGLQLQKLSFEVEAGKSNPNIRDLWIELPNTIIKSEELRAEREEWRVKTDAEDREAE